MVDLRPSDHVRLEVAFTTMPDDPAPAWVDLTSRTDLVAGISRTYGAADEYATVQPSSCSVTLDNKDGALTPGNTGSAFYPNVRPQRRMRLSYRDPAVPGNLLTAEDATFEGGTTGSWGNNYFGAEAASTLTNSVVRAHNGTKSLLITWPTLTAAAGSAAGLVYVRLVQGRTYTVSMWVYVPTGSPDVQLGEIFGGSTTTSTSTKDAWVQLSVTFVASKNDYYMAVSPTPVTVTAGTQCWVDEVKVDEGSTVGTFTTTAPSIQYLFTGHVEEWPTEWPTGGQQYSQTSVTATDRLARIGAKRLMRSVIEETILLASPAIYYPLGEPEGALAGADISGSAGSTPLSIKSFGSGGTVTFGTATGPPTDALPAPTFTPSGANGKYLSGTLAGIGGVSSVSLRASFLTSTAAQATVVRVRDIYGSYIQIEVTAAGKFRGSLFDTFAGADKFSVTSAATVSDGLTHDAVLTLTQSGGTVSAVLYLDGASAGTGSYSSPILQSFSLVTIGGSPDGSVFNGTISHVAAFKSALTLAQVQDQNSATSTGFAGERSDQRIARYATWAGMPVAVRTNLMANPSFEVDTTGWAPVRGTLTRTPANAPYGLYHGAYVSTDGTVTGGNRVDGTPVPCSAGDTLTASAYLMATGTSSPYRLDLQFLDASSAQTALLSYVSPGNLSTSTYARVSITGTAPATTTQVRVRVAAVNAVPIGSGFRMDAVLLENSPTMGSYFDGPTITVNLDVGSSTSVAFTETTGLSILQAMQDIAQTEGGRLFVNGAGDLVFHARSRRYANTASVASVDAENLSGSEQLSLSTQGLVNDLTGQRPDGPQIRAFDSSSISEFGVFNQSLSLLVTSDSEVADAVNWRVSTKAQPLVRLPQATFDLYTDTAVATAVLPVELGDRITISGLPSQVGSASLDFVVEGYSENISLTGWTRAANLSNYTDVQGLTLDDAVYGLLDGDNRLVY